MMLAIPQSDLSGFTAAQDLEIRPLSAAIGVEVLGVDLARPVGDLAFLRIRMAFEQNCLVLFRGQRLSEARHLRFASRFGLLGKPSLGPPSVLYVSNVRDENGKPGILPDGPIDFHSDQSYLEEPSIATTLYAIDIPSRGGNTLFANGFSAYADLSEELKRSLATRKALHDYDYRASPTRRAIGVSPDAKQAIHPIFRLHAPTGRQTLYVNRLMTRSIVDMPQEQSRRTLDFLFDHQERPDYVYEHAWHPGDLIVWDNRSCLHARRDFDPLEVRRLRRIAVLCERT